MNSSNQNKVEQQLKDLEELLRNIEIPTEMLGRNEIRDLHQYVRIKYLAEKGYTIKKIANILGKNISSISDYFKRYPELPKPPRGKPGKIRDQGRYSIIKNLLVSGYRPFQIAKKLGINYHTLLSFVRYHPDLRNCSSERSILSENVDVPYYQKLRIAALQKNQCAPRDLDKYAKIKDLLAEGHDIEEITNIIGPSYSSVIGFKNRYIELKELYHRKKKESSRKPQNLERYDFIRDLLKKGLKQIQIANELNVSSQAINHYLGYYPELREIYDRNRSLRRRS